MYGYIYKTINSVNNRIYIGQKKGQFNPNYYGSGLILKQALNKYGKNSFKLEVIVYAEDKQKLDELERQYIKEYRERFGDLYNITDGGFGGSEPGRKDSSETIENKRSAQNSPEVKKKKHLSMVGKEKTLEHREKIKLSLLGRKHPIERIEKNHLSHIGHVVSSETKKKISNTMLGQKKSSEHCMNMCRKRGPYKKRGSNGP